MRRVNLAWVRQLLAEIESADSIDIVMAFVRRSGLLPFADALREHCNRGRQLRVLTTIYTGSTEAKALDLLVDLGGQVRISYDLSTTRLHAKAWVFRRRSAFSTAYVGSSNLTHSAQVAGMEWNVRVSGARNPDVIDKIEAVFESLLAGPRLHPVRRCRVSACSRPREAIGRSWGANHQPVGDSARAVPRAIARTHRRVSFAGSPPQSACLGYRYWQDRHGRDRLRTTSEHSAQGAAVVRRSS